MEVLNSLFYFIIVIGILVFIHELGHFLAARSCGIRTDIFSFGMGPRLFGYNKVHGFTFGKLKDWEGNGYCDYRICIFPVGGYVKVNGMVDESMDTTALSAEPQEYEFRSKNMLQKIFVLSAGVLMNFLLAIGIFTFITMSQGKIIWKTTTIGYIDKNTIADRIGLKSGDQIIQINGKSISTWDELTEMLMISELGEEKNLTVSRNGTEMRFKADGKTLLKTMTGQQTLGIVPENAYVYVKGVESGKPADKIGLTTGDTIISINNEKIGAFTRLTVLLNQYKNQKILLSWKRGNNLLKDSINPDNNGKLGFYPDVVFAGKREKLSFGFFQSVSEGFKQTYKFSTVFVKSVQQIFKGNISAKESLGGPIMIAKSAGLSAKLGLEVFLNFMAMLSITLAIINILPFPALDGGHIIITIIESIIRREIPLKGKIVIQNIGMFLLLGLMAYAFYNDIMRLFGK